MTDLVEKEEILGALWQRAIDLEPSAPDQAAEADYRRAVERALALEATIDAQRAALGLPTHAEMRAERDASARAAAAAEAAVIAAERAAQAAADAADRVRQSAEKFAAEFAAALPETARRFGALYDGAGRRVAVIQRQRCGEWRTSSLTGEWSGSDGSTTTVIVAEDGRQIGEGEWLASVVAGEYMVRAGELHLHGAMCIPATSASSDWLPVAPTAALYSSDYDASDAWDAAFADRRAAKAAAKSAALAPAQPEQVSPFAALAALKRSV